MVSCSLLPVFSTPPSFPSRSFLVHFHSFSPLLCPFLRGAAMPVLEGLWGPDFRVRDSGLTVGVYPDEPPGSRVWGPLRTPPVTCGGLSLALELPALIRQLRAAWRARRRGPRGPERSEGSTWAEAVRDEADEGKQDLENSSAHLEGKYVLKKDTCVTSVAFYACWFSLTPHGAIPA